MFKSLIISFILLIGENLFGQENRVVVYTYMQKDVYSKSKTARIRVNDTLRLGLKGGWYDTLNVNIGCNRIKIKDENEINLCTNAPKSFYLKIEYYYVFLFGKYKIVEVTEEFAKSEMEKLERRSYRKQE